MHASKGSQTRLNASIGAMQFSPGFLKQHGPQLACLRVGEGGPAITTRDIVIDNHTGFLAVHVEVEQVYSSFVFAFCVKVPLNISVFLSHRGKHSQEVAVAEFPLIHITHLYFVHKYIHLVGFI